MSALVTDPKQQKLKSKLLVPDKGAVYDFRWERAGTRWEHWMDTIPTYKVPDGASFQVRTRVRVRVRGRVGWMEGQAWPLILHRSKYHQSII